MLERNTDLTQLPLTSLQQLYFTEMRKQEQQLIQKVNNKIRLNEMKHSFTKCKEQTTTSPSGRYLGYYKSLLVSGGKDNNGEMAALSNDILTMYNVIINSALSLGTPLQRWKQSIVIMIEKEQNNNRMKKLRVIKIYEADYNLIIKYF